MQEFNSKDFDLEINKNIENTDIVIKLKNGIYSTGQLPQTYKFIKAIFPSVLTTRCINDDELPFAQEVKCTETGHLFEHILIENLYEMKTKQGDKNACIRAETYWNWKRDKKGVFHIAVNHGETDNKIFEKALRKTIKIMRLIFMNTSSFSKTDN